jgi:hypothetical protein
MFFLTLNFSFHPTSSLGPLVQSLFSFFIASFFLQFPILMFKPHSLQSLLDIRISWVVIKVVGPPFESVLLYELNWLRLFICQINCIECFEWLFFNCSFSLFELRRAHSCLQSVVIDASHICEVKSILVVLSHSLFFLIINCVLLLNLVNDKIKVFELLPLEILNSNIGWRNCSMKRAFCWQPLWLLEHLLVVLTNVFIIYQWRKDFCLNYLLHASCHRFAHGVQQFRLVFLFALW